MIAAKRKQSVPIPRLLRVSSNYREWAALGAVTRRVPENREGRGLPRPSFGGSERRQPAATGTGFSIGTPTMLPHSVQLPS